MFQAPRTLVDRVRGRRGRDRQVRRVLKKVKEKGKKAALLAKDVAVASPALAVGGGLAGALLMWAGVRVIWPMLFDEQRTGTKAKESETESGLESGWSEGFVGKILTESEDGFKEEVLNPETYYKPAFVPKDENPGASGDFVAGGGGPNAIVDGDVDESEDNSGSGVPIFALTLVPSAGVKKGTMMVYNNESGGSGSVRLSGVYEGVQEPGLARIRNVETGNITLVSVRELGIAPFQENTLLGGKSLEDNVLAIGQSGFGFTIHGDVQKMEGGGNFDGFMAVAVNDDLRLKLQEKLQLASQNPGDHKHLFEAVQMLAAESIQQRSNSGDIVSDWQKKKMRMTMDKYGNRRKLVRAIQIDSPSSFEDFPRVNEAKRGQNFLVKGTKFIFRTIIDAFDSASEFASDRVIDARILAGDINNNRVKTAKVVIFTGVMVLFLYMVYMMMNGGSTPPVIENAANDFVDGFSHDLPTGKLGVFGELGKALGLDQTFEITGVGTLKNVMDNIKYVSERLEMEAAGRLEIRKIQEMIDTATDSVTGQVDEEMLEQLEKDRSHTELEKLSTNVAKLYSGTQWWLKPLWRFWDPSKIEGMDGKDRMDAFWKFAWDQYTLSRGN